MSYGGMRLLCLQYRYREYLRLETQQSFTIIVYKCYGIGQVCLCTIKIGFVQHNHHLFIPAANALQECTLTFRKRPVCGGNEQDQIAVWNKIFCHTFMFTYHSVDTRRIYNADIA